jgi:hypothetical protein
LIFAHEVAVTRNVGSLAYALGMNNLMRCDITTDGLDQQFCAQTRHGSGSVWERSLTLFEMTHGLCSCHSEQSEKSFPILRVTVG